MWIDRDFRLILSEIKALPVKILRGPRQVGKTSFLAKLGTHEMVYLDDVSLRIQAAENPKLFLDSLPKKIVLDEAPLVPELFSEIKRRVDEERRAPGQTPPLDIWITGSNQTMTQRNVRESLAGRASYFDLNTLSIHELGSAWSLSEYLFKGGWPELYASPNLSSTRYLNDLIATFIEKDIVSAAGIERRESFAKCLQLTAARIAQLYNFSDVGKNCSADTATVQSWLSILEQNGILRQLRPFSNNLNQRLIKSSKFYFEDVALATRLQGWTEVQPLTLSPVIGHLLENIAVGEVARFFINRGEQPQLNFVRSKEKVEVDLLIHLPNNRCIAAEVKSTPEDMTPEQLRLLETLGLNIIERWIISPTSGPRFGSARSVLLNDIWKELQGAV